MIEARTYAQLLTIIGGLIAGAAAVPAHSFTLNYTIGALASYAPEGHCTNSQFGSLSCGVGFSNVSGGNVGGFPLDPLPYLPIIDPVEVWVDAHATSGPINVPPTGGRARFQIPLDGVLLRTRVQSDGQFTVFDPDLGYSASGYGWPSIVSIGINETLKANIPAAYDGLAVNALVTLPIAATGDGSSWGEVFAAVSSPVVGRRTDYTSFGRLNVHSDLPYEVDTHVGFDIVIREAGSNQRTIDLPFEFQASFRSSTTNGPGHLTSLNSIGLAITSLEGVAFTSESGHLDTLLAVPEPGTYMLWLSGIVCILCAGRRRHCHAAVRMQNGIRSCPSPDQAKGKT